MRNGGLPPAHLPSSSLSDPSAWLQYKWSQPPPRAPNWVFEDFRNFNPPANVGSPFHDEEWVQRALCKDQQAASLLPPISPGGPILLGARACAEHAYQAWKWRVDDLWEDERHRLQPAARQCHIDEETAHQRLLDEETARCQRLLDEEAARRLMAERAALARQMAAAQTIFLWLRRCHLHVRLASQTSQQQQREAALARLQYKQDCCSRAVLAEEQHLQAAAVRAKALADEADERHRQDALAKEQCRHEANKRRLQDVLANEQCRHEVAACDAALVELALAEEQRRRELAEHAAVMAENALAAEQRCRESAERSAAMAENALAREQRGRELVECAAERAEKALAMEQRRRELAERAAATAEKALAKD
jgi:hypothetical protein